MHRPLWYHFLLSTPIPGNLHSPPTRRFNAQTTHSLVSFEPLVSQSVSRDLSHSRHGRWHPADSHTLSLSLSTLSLASSRHTHSLSLHLSRWYPSRSLALSLTLYTVAGTQPNNSLSLSHTLSRQSMTPSRHTHILSLRLSPWYSSRSLSLALSLSPHCRWNPADTRALSCFTWATGNPVSPPPHIFLTLSLCHVMPLSPEPSRHTPSISASVTSYTNPEDLTKTFSGTKFDIFE